MACLHSSHTRPRNGCFRAILACFGRKTGGELPWRCLLRGSRRQPPRQALPWGEGNLPWPQGNDLRILGGKPLRDAIELRQPVIAQGFGRALASLVDPGQGAGAVLKRARSRPLHSSSRGSVWSVRGRVFRQLRFGGSPRAVASIGSDNIRYRKRFLGGLMSAAVTKERSLRAPQRSPSRIRGGAFRPLGSGCSPRGGAPHWYT